MADTPAPAAPKAEVVPPAPAADQNAEVEALKIEVAKLKAHNASERAKAKATVEPPPPAEELTLKEEVRRLKEERRIEREEAIANTRRTDILAAIAGHRITGENAKEIEARVHYEFGKHVKHESGVTIFEDPETGEKKDIATFIAERFLQGASKDRYKAAPESGPDTRGLGTKQTSGGRRFFHELSKEEQDKAFKDGTAAAMVREDMASGR